MKDERNSDAIDKTQTIETKDDFRLLQRYFKRYQIDKNRIIGISRIRSSANEKGRIFVALANINRNILLSDIDAYLRTLNNGGELFMSGFLDSDVEVMCRTAEERGLKLNKQRHTNGWAALSFIKQ